MKYGGHFTMKNIKRILVSAIMAAMIVSLIPAVQGFADYDDSAFAPTLVNATRGEWGGAEHLFDRLFSDDANSKWCVNWNDVAHPAYVIFRYSRPVSARGYSIVTGNDTASYGKDRNPKSWALYGSDNGEIWTLVDRIENDTKLPAANNTEVLYTMEKATEEFSWWKWEISEIVNGGCMQVNEFSLLRAGAEVPQYVDGTPGIWGMPTNALDGITGSCGNSKWCVGFEGSASVTWKYDAPMSISSYSLFTGGDTHVNPGRNPQSWTLYGSDNGSDWKAIDQRTDDVTMGATSIEEYVFYLDTPSVAYSYFRLEITKIRGGNCLQLAEIVLHRAEPQDIRLCGYQVSQKKEPTYSVRFLAVIDRIDFDEIGYQITVSYGGKTSDPYTHAIRTVYDRVLGTVDGVEEEYSAGALGGTYLAALTLTGFPADAGDTTIIVTPYTLKDGMCSYGYTYRLVLNGGNQVRFERVAD